MTPSKTSSSAENIVIIGGGIVGLCAAHSLLTCPALPAGSTITLVENSSIAAGASSKAGGLIARDWHGQATLPLTKLSWELHVKLAEIYNGAQRFGWREAKAVGFRVGGGTETERSAYRTLPKGQVETLDEDDWLFGGEREDLTGNGGIAQIDPALFCKVIHEECRKLGLVTLLGSPKSLSPSTSTTTKRSLTIIMDDSSSVTVPVTSLVITAGPWSAAVAETLKLKPINYLINLPGHSLLIRPSNPIPAEICFAGIGGAEVGVEAATSGTARLLTPEEISQGFTQSPELFPRPDGLVYVAGENSIPTTPNSTPASGLPNRLPQKASMVKELFDEKLSKRLQNSAKAVSRFLDVDKGAAVEVSQFCYRPVTLDLNPVLGEIEKGVYIGTGNGPWGICQSTGMGQILSDMVLGQPLSTDISQLSPQRFD